MSNFFLVYGIPFLENSVFGQDIPLPPDNNFRITEDGQNRETESGDIRIVEG